MHILTVVSHPRVNSLTFSAAAKFTQGLADAGHHTELLDLHRSGFDPVLREADEPDWSSDRQIFSPDVEAEMERMKKHDALAFVFPVWWYDLPAMLKGYIDRVWNNGFAYGSNKLPHRKVLWLGLAADSKEHMAKRQYEQMMNRHLNVAIAGYCGISNSKVELLYDTLDEKPEVYDKILTQAYQLGRYYDND
ncbi:NAD(P)H oxidoreductase [Cohnella sp. REN36]|uniref:NAD(P)H oxidoreductase n=1 Tax=Cohnella sp. REN36 TaxID=2887347 RepID=UPI001D13FC51|nr:NAD(P)H oxidoreductase [Cohnella sp. REN36]MCC3376305.1 NAD(P)H oxidoreductase [Cohnella sp. REN36]